MGVLLRNRQPGAKDRVTVRSCAAVLGTATALCPYQLFRAELD